MEKVELVKLVKLPAFQERLHMNVFYVLYKLLMLLKRERTNVKMRKRRDLAMFTFPASEGEKVSGVTGLPRLQQDTGSDPRRVGDSDSLERIESNADISLRGRGRL